MRTPPSLKKGDRIGIVSPAGVSDIQLIKQAERTINESGFACILGKHVDNQHGIYAGTDLQRLQDVQAMLDDPSIKAIIFSRGGYGSMRIIKQLRLGEFLTNYKWLVGFSDITVFHAMAGMMGIKSLHGPMVNGLAKGLGNSDNQSLFSILAGTMPTYETESSPYNKEGEASGILIGGNLSMLYSLRGTPYDMSTNGRILFIEDINEYLYHLDRMLVNLSLGGMFGKLKGIIVGEMSNMKEGSSPYGKSANEIIYEHVSPLNIPVLFNFPAGHTKTNMPLLLGNRIHLTVTKDNGKVSFSDQ